MVDNKTFHAWAVIFGDGEPLHLSISRTQKSSIALACDYFGESWKALKNRNMRCVQIKIERLTVDNPAR